MSKEKELEYACKLIEIASRLPKELTIRITTYDDAIDALKEKFEIKGDVEIKNRSNFVKFVNGYLPSHQRDNQMIIDSIYKVAANEYLHSKSKLESAR